MQRKGNAIRSESQVKNQISEPISKVLALSC